MDLHLTRSHDPKQSRSTSSSGDDAREFRLNENRSAAPHLRAHLSIMHEKEILLVWIPNVHAEA